MCLSVCIGQVGYLKEKVNKQVHAGKPFLREGGAFFFAWHTQVDMPVELICLKGSGGRPTLTYIGGLEIG